MSVWFTIVVGTALSEYPDTCPEDPFAVQVNKVPVTDDVRMILVILLLHCDFAAGMFVRVGVGNTVTT